MPGRATNDPANYFAIAKQPAKGTEGSTFYFLKHLDGTGMELAEQTENVREGGNGQEIGFIHKTQITFDGAAIANARPEWAARAAAYVLGADTVAAGASNASGTSQIHTSVPTSTIPYLTVEQAWADPVIERGVDARMTSFELEGEAGRPLKITTSLITGGTPYQPTSAQSPARETAEPFFYPGGSYTLTGASGARMTKFKATISRGLDTDIFTTQLFRDDVVALNFETTLEGTLKYEDKTLYNQVHYLGSTVISPLALGLATGAFQAYTEFGAGSGWRFFEYNQPLVVFTGARVNKLDADGKTMYIDFTAMGIKSATHQVYTRIQTATSGAY